METRGTCAARGVNQRDEYRINSVEARACASRRIIDASIVAPLTQPEPELALPGVALVGWVAPNVPTTFNPHVAVPTIAASARIHPLASVIGSVTIGELIFIAPGASVRGDEGQNIYVGDHSNVQGGVVIHGLETFEGDHELPENEVQV